ncbi:hypothetical protein IWW55_004760, partial [Coemansia sp. RSA 2706]
WAAERMETAEAALAVANQAKDKTKYTVDKLLRSQQSTALGALSMPLTHPYSKSQAKPRKPSDKQPLLPAEANAISTAAIEHRRSNPSVASPPSHAITPRADTETKRHGTAGAETADQLEGWKRLNGSLTIGQMLGEGRSGTMHQGKYNGRPAALKISFADAAPEIFEEMRNEVAVYEQLADLQGTDIPQLYDWGLADIDGFQCAVIVLEELTDVLSGISEECKAEYLSMAERECAICALSRLHDRDIVHGDPRMNNFLFVRAASTSNSAQWGHYLGSVYADHFDFTNRWRLTSLGRDFIGTIDAPAARFSALSGHSGSGIFGDSMLAELNQSRSRFDPIDFYLRVGTILYQRGF